MSLAPSAPGPRGGGGTLAETDVAICSESFSAGSKVGLITVKALLSAEALHRLDGAAYRFCPDPACDIVYFDRAADSVFLKSDLRTRVGLKEKSDPVPICYCFDITVGDLRQDVAKRGATNIPAMVAAEVRAGHCACEVRNPQGSCCLGNLSRAVEAIEAGSVPTSDQTG